MLNNKSSMLVCVECIERETLEDTFVVECEVQVIWLCCHKGSINQSINQINPGVDKLFSKTIPFAPNHRGFRAKCTCEVRRSRR